MGNETRGAEMQAGNPRRKFYLLVALTEALGPDLGRRELSCKQLEELATKHGVDVSKVPA